MSEQEAESWIAPHPPEGGACYRALIWLLDAVSEQFFSACKHKRAELVARMRDAGTRGARGALALAQQELHNLNRDIRQQAFAFRTRAQSVRIGALRAALQADGGVLGYRLGDAAAEVWVELTDEIGVDEHVRQWKEALPDAAWSPESIIEQVSEQDARDMQRAAHAAGAEDAVGEMANVPAYCHTSVLLQEAVEMMGAAEGKVMVDATLGGGGHSERLLQAGASVWGIDQDPMARAAARQRLASYGEKLHVLAGNFRDVKTLLHSHGVDAVDGVLADLGISSPQVDTAERGFSFMAEGPLDMRMNPSLPRSAADIVNEADETELADILWQYGEERAARAIARRIVQQREHGRITTTTQLARIINSVLPRKGRQHPATRSFQALRIAVNDELGALDDLLSGGLSLLRSGGRMAIITFHSLEDRKVKHFFERVTRPEIDRPEWAQPRPNPEYTARSVTRKPVVPGEAELTANPRSRSAKLRVIEKL